MKRSYYYYVYELFARKGSDFRFEGLYYGSIKQVRAFTDPSLSYCLVSKGVAKELSKQMNKPILDVSMLEVTE